MIWILALLTLPAYSQVDLSAVRKLDEKLPSFNDYKENDVASDSTPQNREHRSPIRKVSAEKILASGTQYGAIPKGSFIRNIQENRNYATTKLMYVKVFNLEDEHGFKYIQNKDGSMTFRVRSRFVEPIKEVTALYEPPLKYTPAPLNIVHTEYDKKLSIPPEASIYVGTVQGNYMMDLFNDKNAKSGTSYQYGLHLFTQWKLPLKVGSVFHYERATYKLANGGQVIYSAPSLGPQFKTREFEILGQPFRFQTQFRVSPFAKASGQTPTGETVFKFNSADLLTSIERPMKNRFGEFVLGLYVQSQWLNLKDRPSNVEVSSTNATNNSYGVSLAQVFE